MASDFRARSRPARVLIALAALSIVSVGAPAVSAKEDPGTLTGRTSMLDVIVPGGWEQPIITVGDAAIGGYSFEALPDGISVWDKHGQTVEVFVNHETSRVPFPLQATGAAWNPTTNTTTSGAAPGSQNDYVNSLLSHLVVNRKTGGVISGSVTVPSSANFQRFCSQTLANGMAFGFESPLLFLNEEGSDFVSRSGNAYPALPQSEPPNSQIGYVVAYNPDTGAYQTVPGMGRVNHENALAIRGYHKPVLITTDDTFVSSPPESQVYMYVANDAASVWNDTGDLYVFRATNTTANDYYDFTPAGTTMSVSGEFAPITKATAVGPQAGLEAASDAANAFQFVRTEDLAYDKTDPNIVYIADTGRASNTTTNGHASTNGRIWKMVLNKKDPLKVDSLSILYDGDAVGLGQVNVIHQPDNMETTNDYLYVTEDPSSANQGVSPGRIWRIALHGPGAGTAEIVANVLQTYDGDPSMDVDGFSNAAQGYWESSGIIDVSTIFGPGTFLVTIQAHSLWVAKTPEADNWTRTGGTHNSWTPGPDGFPDWMNKREGGQLILVKIPGG
jgi:hypothetical protein